MVPSRHRRLKFFDAPDDAISPMPREFREHYHARQLEHERRGEWEQANRVNQWLAAAFMSVTNVVDDTLPPVRQHFLRRLWKAEAIHSQPVTAGGSFISASG